MERGALYAQHRRAGTWKWMGPRGSITVKEVVGHMAEEMVSRAEYERLRRALKKKIVQLKEKTAQMEALRSQLEMLRGTTIFELEDALNELKIEQRRYEIVAELSDDIIFEYDRESDILLTFYPGGEEGRKQHITADFLRASHWQELGMSEQTLRRIQQEAERVCAQGGVGRLEYPARLPGGVTWQRIWFKCVLDDDNRLMRLVGRQSSIDAERALLDKSRTDPLTGVFNRTYLEYDASTYLQQTPAGMFGACLMIDVDYFKTINDTCGHLTGDTLLRDLAKCFQGLFRSSDIIARIGGDEFMIFLKNLLDMSIVLEKAQQMLTKTRQLGEAHQLPMPLTLSIGVADTRQMVDSFQELYRRSDIALYHAKASGRNCYRVYEAGMHYPAGFLPQTRQEDAPPPASQAPEHNT